MIFAILCTTLFANGQSAVRASHESWLKAAHRAYPIYGARAGGSFKIGVPEMAFENRKAWKDIDQWLIPEWKQNDENFDLSFRQLRDHRFLHTSILSRFPRRISWLYPDEGCFVRAELMERLLEQWGYQTAAKIFAFGDLKLVTENSPEGFVTWWYHVAIAFRKDNKVYIFDPGMEPRWPLYFEEWASQMSKFPSAVTYAVCEPGTISPFDDCRNPKKRSLSLIEKYQKEFLELEWDRMLYLRKNPNKVLGEEPPWMHAPLTRPSTEPSL